MTPDELQRLLREPNPRTKEQALQFIIRHKVSDPVINLLLVDLLTSRDVIPRHTEYAMAEHHAVADVAAVALVAANAREAAVQARLRDLATTGTMLDWAFPQASFDQGAYIGEYHSETVSPAALAQRTLRLLGQ